MDDQTFESSIAHLVAEAVTKLDNLPKHKAKSYSHYLASLVGAIVYRGMMAKPEKPCSREELEKFTLENFKKTKHLIQESIAAGMTGAMKTYSGQTLDYYCYLKAIGDSANKEPI